MRMAQVEEARDVLVPGLGRDDKWFGHMAMQRPGDALVFVL